MRKNFKISVVIPTYNSWITLKECISSIQKQSFAAYEIIIVDNGSSDGTSEKVKTYFPKAKLITLKKNYGVTGGRNKGIDEASAKASYVLFFDHDMVANRRMLEELINAARLDSSIGIVTPKIYYDDDKRRIWSAGTGINLWTGQVLFRGGYDKGQYDQVEEVQVAPAVLLVKKEVIAKVKIFDERYFATYEDTDFCFRTKKLGFKVFYAPKAFAFHKIPSDPHKESLRLLARAYLIGRNRIFFMKDFGNNYYIFLLFLPVFLAYYLRLAISCGRLWDFFRLLQGTMVGLVLTMFSKKIIFRGERPSLSDIEGQHLAKYKFALSFCKKKSILEIGCGSGYGSKFLVENGASKIKAFDIDSKAINFAIVNYPDPRIKFANADAQTLKLKEKFDIFLSFEVIEHLSKPDKLLELAQEAIKEKGFVVISTPNKKFSILDNGKPSNPYHIHEYFPDEFEEMLKRYFKSVQLYGVILSNPNVAKEENKLHRSFRWKLINFTVNKRWIRRLMNYIPEYPKRLLSGEARLSFKTEDFKVIKNSAEESNDIVAVCR